jgi:flavodoxin
MKRAVIVYRSRTGTTRRLAQEIGRFLASRDIEPRVVSVGDCDVRALGDVDFLLLGSWTSGLMIVRQHPDQPWIDFARAIPRTAAPRVVPSHLLELKSRSGALSESDRRALDRFVAGS